ncbi:MAG: hypothetical protein ACLPND_25870 [Candidatus Korobacteraceae bacterium]
MQPQADTPTNLTLKRWFAVTLFAALTVTMSMAQGANPAAGPSVTSGATVRSTSATTQARGFFTVELTKPLDSKKLKEGDEVEAKLAAGITITDGTTIPSGSKVIGHVTEAKARSNHDSESTLGIVFDKIVRRSGGDTPIKSVIEAAAPNPNARNDSGNANSVDYGGRLDDATVKGALPRLPSGGTPILNEESRGVLGIKNLQLGPNGVFISSGREVKLDNGIQMLLEVTM